MLKFSKFRGQASIDVYVVKKNRQSLKPNRLKQQKQPKPRKYLKKKSKLTEYHAWSLDEDEDFCSICVKTMSNFTKSTMITVHEIKRDKCARKCTNVIGNQCYVRTTIQMILCEICMIFVFIKVINIVEFH